MNQVPSSTTRILASCEDATTALQRLARAVTPTLADFCMIFLVEGDNIPCVASAHITRGGTRALNGLMRVYKIRRKDLFSTVAQVVRTGRTQLRRDITAEHDEPVANPPALAFHRQLAPRSALVAPIVANGQVLGALSLGHSESGRRFDPAEVPRVQRLAARIGAAIANRRLARAAARHAALTRRTKPLLVRRPRARF